MTLLGRVLLVRVGDERVALPLGAVRELVDAPTLLPVPMAPAAVRGQLALRGQHIPVLALSVLLDIPHASADPAATCVALVMAADGYAVAVDDVIDVLEPQDDRLRPAPAGADRQGTIRALLHLGRDVALLVDAPALTRVAVATLRTESPV